MGWIFGLFLLVLGAVGLTVGGTQGVQAKPFLKKSVRLLGWMLLLGAMLNLSGCTAQALFMLRNWTPPPPPTPRVHRHVEARVRAHQQINGWVFPSDDVYHYQTTTTVVATDVHLEGYDGGQIRVKWGQRTYGGAYCSIRGSSLDRWHTVGGDSGLPLEKSDRCLELRVQARGTSSHPIYEVTVHCQPPGDGRIRISTVYGLHDGKGGITPRLLGMGGKETGDWGILPPKAVGWTLYVLARQADGSYLTDPEPHPRALIRPYGATSGEEAHDFTSSGLKLQSSTLTYDEESELAIESDQPVRLVSTLVLER